MDNREMEALERFFLAMTSALDFGESKLNFREEMPTTVVDMSKSLSDLATGHADSIFGSRVPIVFPIQEELGLDFADELHTVIAGLEPLDSSLVFVLPFIEQSSLEQQRTNLVARVRKDGYDIVLVGREDLAHILTSSDPLSQLRAFVLSQFDLTKISPYHEVGPVPDHAFFGREAELSTILQYIKNKSFAVIGSRRIGKTSILLRLHRIRLPAAGFHTLYHDCSSTPTYDSFLAAAIRSWQPESSPDTPTTFGDLLRSPPTEKPLVMLLDEVDKLVPAEHAAGWSLLNALRALANSGYAQVVFSGERILRDAVRDSRSPLFNFANEILLGPLDYRAVEALVIQPMKRLEIELIDEKAMVDRIWAFTSGHPNVVQRLCRRLIERLNERGTRQIALDDINAIIEDPAFQRDDFLSTYWEAAPPLEKMISLLMADDENVRTMHAVRQALAERCNLRPKAREVDDALQRLVDLRSILNRIPAGYEFAVEAFPRVVAGTMTLDDMLEIFTEEYLERNE